MSVLVRPAFRYRDAFLGSVDAWPRPGRTQGSVRQFPAVPGITVGPGRRPSPNVRLNPPCWCRNVDLPSIGYAFRPGLRCRLTPGGRTCPGKPWDSGDQDSHLVFRYSCPHNRWWKVHRRLRARLLPVPPRSPTVVPEGTAREFGAAFTPDHFRRRVSRVVSCYALFKGWLPLSQHPTCPRDFTALVTERRFGALFGGRGLFPFRQWSLAPTVSLPGCRPWPSEFDGLRYPGRDPRSISALHPRGAFPDAAPKGISERTSYHPA